MFKINKEQEEFLKDELNYFASEQIILHSRGFDRHELTTDEFSKENDRITKKILGSIEWAMTEM